MRKLKRLSQCMVVALFGACLLAFAMPAWAGDGGGGRGDDQEEIWKKRKEIDETVDKIGDELKPTPWSDPDIPDYDDKTPKEQDEIFKKWRRERYRLEHAVSEQIAKDMMGL